MKNIKRCIIFGHREADIGRKDELKLLFSSLIEEEKVKEFVFCEVNKFSYMCFDVLGQLKEKYNIKRVFAFSDNKEEYNLKLLRKMIFDEFFMQGTTFKVFSIYSLIMESNFVLVQYFKTLKDKDNIIDFAKRHKISVIKF